MKKEIKSIIKNMVILSIKIFILTLILFFLYAIIHEILHFTICESIGLHGKFNINPFTNPPTYEVRCDGINEKSIILQFFFRTSPYIFSLLLMFIIYLFLKYEKIYFISLPLSIIIFDSMNLFYILDRPENDLFKTLLLGKCFFILILVIISVMIILGIMIIFKLFYKFFKSLPIP